MANDGEEKTNSLIGLRKLPKWYEYVSNEW